MTKNKLPSLFLRRVGVIFLAMNLLGGCASIEPRAGDLSDDPEPALSADQRMLLARAAYDAGDVNEAMIQYREVIASDNLNRKANYNLTIIHLDLALKGMEFLGQFVRNNADAREARTAFDNVVDQAERFTKIVSRHAVE